MGRVKMKRRTITALVVSLILNAAAAFSDDTLRDAVEVMARKQANSES